MDAIWASLLEVYRRWHGEQDLARLTKAYRLLTDLSRAYGQAQEQSSPHHALSVGVRMAEMGADAPVVCAALLHGVYERRDERAHRGFLEQEFGREVVDLLERSERLQHTQPQAPIDDRAWDALVDAVQHEPRLLFLLLAHRLVRLEECATTPESDASRSYAQHTLRLTIPLASRLGIARVQEAMEDLCCRVLMPSEYAALAAERVAMMERMRARVRLLEQEIRSLDRAGDMVSLTCSHPSLASLLLASRGAQSVDIPETVHINIVVGSPERAYRFVLLLHARWKPVPSSFRDYVAVPRPTGEQALQTEVLTENCGRVLFRIVTPAMAHRNAYGLLGQGVEQRKLVAMLSLQRETVASEGEKATNIREVLEEQKIVYDDRKQQHAIPLQATALDAAFLLYADDAAHISSVSVDGKQVSFATVVPEGSVVTIEQAEGIQVRTEWLAEVATTIVTFAIQRALKRRSFQEKVALGQRILQKQFDVVQSGLLVSMLAEERMMRALRTFGASSFDEVLARLAEGVLSATDLYDALFPPTHEADRTMRAWLESFLNRLLHRVNLDATFAIIGNREACPDPAGIVATLAQRRGIQIQREVLTVDPALRTFHLRFSCAAPDRAALFTFLLTLEQELGFTSVRALLSQSRRIAFLGFTILNIVTWLTPFVTLPHLTTGFSQSVALSLSLIPVVAANILLFHYVRNYLTRFRESTQLFLVWAAINLAALCLFLLLTTYATPVTSQTSLLGVLALFIAATLLTTYQYLSTHNIFHPPPRNAPLSAQQWGALRRRKAIGYSLRLAAVSVWGLQPLYLRYTPANAVDPFVRVFLTSVGVLLVTGILLLGKLLLMPQRPPTLRIPRNVLLVNIIVGQAFFTYFLNASLRFTTSTNFILFNNFSPVLALVAAALLWRASIPYLKDPRNVLWIFLIFLLGSTGSALVIYNDVRHLGGGTVYGDVLGMLAMIADTLLVVSQIRYMKVYATASSLSINLHVFSFLAVTTLPILGVLYFTGHPMVRSLTLLPVLYGVGAGVLSGAGKILNYETFRRIDGFIAFLMFNISILITFTIEVFFLGKLSPTWVLLLGAVTIVGSTILAELINSRCERKGL